jgi:hypothetical protein
MENFLCAFLGEGDSSMLEDFGSLGLFGDFWRGVFWRGDFCRGDFCFGVFGSVLVKSSCIGRPFKGGIIGFFTGAFLLVSISSPPLMDRVCVVGGVGDGEMAMGDWGGLISW